MQRHGDDAVGIQTASAPAAHPLLVPRCDVILPRGHTYPGVSFKNKGAMGAVVAHPTLTSVPVQYPVA